MSQFKYLLISGPSAKDWQFCTTEFLVDLHDADEAPKEQLPFFQKAVDGYVEYVRLSGCICAIINDEGKPRGLPPTAAWIRDGRVLDILVGKILVVRDDASGATLPIKESDLPIIKKHLRPLIPTL